MSSILQHVPPIAGDCAGAAEIFSAFRSVNLFYSPTGCLAAMRMTWGTDAFPQSPVLSAKMGELDAVVGMTEKFIDSVDELMMHNVETEFIAIIGAPVSAVSGVNLDFAARQIEKKWALPVLTVETNGFNSCYYGMHLAYLALAKRFIEPKKKFSRSVNILGSSRLSLGRSADLGELIRVIKQCGLDLGCIFGQCGDLAALRTSAQAQLNLVLSHEAIGLAEYMKEQFGISYVLHFPAGRTGMYELISIFEQVFAVVVPTEVKVLYEVDAGRTCSKNAMIVAPPLIGAAVKKCLQREYRIETNTVCSFMPLEKSLPRLSAHQELQDILITEDERLLSRMFSQADIVIADPAFQCLVKNADYIPLVCPAISGRIFAEQDRNLIGKNAIDQFTLSQISPDTIFETRQ